MMKYCIQFDRAAYIKNQLIINDVNQTSFTFQFDETATSQVKRQCDSYLDFWSNKHNIVNAHVDSVWRTLRK